MDGKALRRVGGGGLHNFFSLSEQKLRIFLQMSLSMYS
jgi:hypothetical protein